VTGYHGPLALVAAVLSVAAWASDSRPNATNLAADIGAERDHITAPELAERIMRGDAGLRVIDLRSAGEFAQFHIPGAKRVAIEDLASASLPRETTIVLYSEGGAHAAQAWVLLRMRGYRDALFLREGIYEWISRVYEPRLAVDATPAERTQFERAATMSRFFGGVPKADVPRSEVPVGYWSGGTAPAASTKQVIAGIRRRGC
jgi:rhodanese-related sulfurtransferase